MLWLVLTALFRQSCHGDKRKDDNVRVLKKIIVPPLQRCHCHMAYTKHLGKDCFFSEESSHNQSTTLINCTFIGWASWWDKLMLRKTNRSTCFHFFSCVSFNVLCVYQSICKRKYCDCALVMWESPLSIFPIRNQLSWSDLHTSHGSDLVVQTWVVGDKILLMVSAHASSSLSQIVNAACATFFFFMAHILYETQTYWSCKVWCSRLAFWKKRQNRSTCEQWGCSTAVLQSSTKQ